MRRRVRDDDLDVATTGRCWWAARPIASIPPYVVIAFELTILLGALSTVAAVALFSVLMGKRGIAYDPRFSDDQIGIFVPARRRADRRGRAAAPVGRGGGGAS